MRHASILALVFLTAAALGAPRRDAGAQAEPEPSQRAPRYRGNPTCTPVCMPDWERCVGRCDAGFTGPCVEACESEYRACMRACL